MFELFGIWAILIIIIGIIITIAPVAIWYHCKKIENINEEIYNLLAIYINNLTNKDIKK